MFLFTEPFRKGSHAGYEKKAGQNIPHFTGLCERKMAAYQKVYRPSKFDSFGH